MSPAKIVPSAATATQWAGLEVFGHFSLAPSALKIAMQVRVNSGEPGRNRFVSLRDSYHGDTLGAMGVGFVPAFHTAFEGVLPWGLVTTHR